MAKKYDAQKAIKALGLKVRSLRNEKGWTLEETESHGWPSWRHLQKIEAGKNVTLVTLVKIANLFEIELSDLFSDL